MAKKEKKKEDKKKKAEPKIVLERTYNVPLRREWLKAPKYKRSKKAISAVRKFLAKHMKSEDIKIGKNLNEAIWKQGIKSPPHHVKIDAVKYDDDLVKAELSGIPIEKPEEKKKEKKKEEVKEKEKLEEKIEKKEKITEKVEHKPELAEEALKEQEELKEEEEADKVSADLEKEELGDAEKVEEEKEIKETIKEIKETPAEKIKSESKTKPKE